MRKTANTIKLTMTMLLVAVLVLYPAASSIRAEDSDEEVIDPIKVEIAMTLELDEAAAAEEKAYTFVLEGKDDDTPLPEEKAEIELTGAGTVNFGEITFAEPGDYYYTVKQTTEAEVGFTLDNTVYSVYVYVYLDDSTGKDVLKYEVICGKEGETAKTTGVVFKNSYENVPGSLLITKYLDTKEEVEGRLDPVTFVFSVDITYKGETFLSNVYSMVFTSWGSDQILIEDIPSGAVAVVKEVYAGSNYHIDGAGILTKTIEPEKTAEIEFTNVYDKTWKGGGSVTNTITGPSEADKVYAYDNLVNQ